MTVTLHRFVPHHRVADALALGWCPSRDGWRHHDAYSRAMWRCAHAECVGADPFARADAAPVVPVAPVVPDGPFVGACPDGRPANAGFDP